MPKPRVRSPEEMVAPVVFDENGAPLRDADGNAVTTMTPSGVKMSGHVMDAKEITKPVTMEELIRNLRDVLEGDTDPKVAASRVAAARLIAELAKMIKSGEGGPRAAVQINIASRESVRAERERGRSR